MNIKAYERVLGNLHSLLLEFEFQQTLGVNLFFLLSLLILLSNKSKRNIGYVKQSLQSQGLFILDS